MILRKIATQSKSYFLVTLALWNTKKKPERSRIEAMGIYRAQRIIDSSLTTRLLQYNNIEIMKWLVNSPNAKVIITNGQLPNVMVDPSK